MKISAMDTNQAADVFCRISEPIEQIGTNEAFQKRLIEIAEKNKKRGRPMNTIESATSMIGTFVPLLLKDCREQTFEILSALTGKTPEEIGSQNVLETIKDAKGCVDQDLIDFFKSSVATGDGHSSPQSPKE